MLLFVQGVVVINEANAAVKLDAGSEVTHPLGVATENSKSSEKSRVLIITAVVSPACLSSSDRSFLGLPTDSVVPTENSEISQKSRVLRITALMSPACLSLSSDQSFRLWPADSVVGQLLN